MKSIFTISPFLTYAISWVAVSLTLVLGVTLPLQPLRAAEDDTSFNAASIPVIADRSTDSPIDQIDKNRRLGLLLDYVRKEGPGWAPGLANSLRSPLRSAQNMLGFGGSDGDEDEFIPPALRPVSSLMQPPSPEEAEALWLTPGYHHKGFLPLHDAMVASINLRHRMWDDYLQFDIRPFYGQNWMSTDSYWGTEFGINIGGNAQAKPWGRVVMRYNEGDDALMEHGHGFDMHAELRFNDNVSLNAGIRESEETQLGNYILLRWHAIEFNP